MAFSLLRVSVNRNVLSLIEKVNCMATFLYINNKKLPIERKQLGLSTNYAFHSIREYNNSKQTNQKVKKGYASESDSDDDNDDDDDVHSIQPRAESEFWRRKMRTIHSILDVNKDGVISYDDFKLLSDKFVNLGHLSEREAGEFQKCIKDLWENQWGEISPYNSVNVNQYLEDMHHVLNDKQLKKKVHTFLPFLFKAVNQHKSGDISIDEFKLFYACLGIDEVHAVVSFSLIDTNNDGKLSLKEFIKHGRDYFLSEKCNGVSKLFWGPLVP